ncbi:MAG: helix-turn-helix transcriptional regulator, partial [Spirochaetales bacterium]|nr:helix-turn-helix transcriptional regulator [Spirochaetales bacterium]
MKRQKQIDESKQMLAAAFSDLLRERDFNKITLSEIADRAGVTRMTLYRLFKSKEKIILHLAQRSLDEQR